MRHALSDADWAVLSRFLPASGPAGRPQSDDRLVLNGIAWKLRTGTPGGTCRTLQLMADPLHAFPQVGTGRYLPPHAPGVPGREGRGRGHRPAPAEHAVEQVSQGRVIAVTGLPSVADAPTLAR
ncbi:transposase [Kitasatospora purpeofusca]|uniref:transposase n=1 Tax=Kitasatospora purpeofusca TaxID=67352 RepID=UPI00364F3129